MFCSYGLKGNEFIFNTNRFDTFEKFTEEDVKMAVYHDLFISDTDGGFQMYASM